MKIKMADTSLVSRVKTTAGTRRNNHRRTGNFLPGGAVNHLPKKISYVAQIFTKESKRNESHIANNIGRPGI